MLIYLQDSQRTYQSDLPRICNNHLLRPTDHSTRTIEVRLSFLAAGIHVVMVVPSQTTVTLLDINERSIRVTQSWNAHFVVLGLVGVARETHMKPRKDVAMSVVKKLFRWSHGDPEPWVRRVCHDVWSGSQRASESTLKRLCNRMTLLYCAKNATIMT